MYETQKKNMKENFNCIQPHLKSTQRDILFKFSLHFAIVICIQLTASMHTRAHVYLLARVVFAHEVTQGK